MSDAYHYEPDPNSPDPAHGTDPWHAHGGPEEAPSQEAHGAEVSGAAVLVWMISLFVVVFLAILVVIFYFEQYKQREVAVRREIALDQNAQSVNGAAFAELRSVGWIDESEGLIQVPIELAMDDVVEWYREQQ